MHRRHENGIASQDKIAAGRRSPPANTPNSLNGKFTLTLDCSSLLTPDASRSGVYTSKSAEEVVNELELESLIPVSLLNQIKFKLFHTCGQIEFEEGSCLRTLWGVGDWFVERYAENGKPAQYEKLNRGINDDFSEPDATLILNLG